MGDRINLKFIDKEGNESPVLYSHWKGTKLLDEADIFYNKFHDKIRSEPTNWMVNFVVWLRCGGWKGGKISGPDAVVEDGYEYLYKDFNEISADDNGDWVFNTDTGSR